MASKPDSWFKDGEQIWKPQEEVKRDHDQFKSRLKHLLKFETPESQLASTKDELLTQIKEVEERQQSPSYATANERFDKVIETQDAYQGRRQRGAPKAANKLQRGLSTFAEFISCYSSILSAVAEAGGPYAIIGYQTLSVFLIVFVNKTQNDDRLLSHLVDLRKSVASLDRWELIYPTDSMRELVLSCYGHVLEFCRSATKYFSSFRKRAWLAVNPVARPGFDTAAAAIHRTLASINADAMQCLHGRTKDIETELQKLRQSEAKAQEELQHLREYNERRDREQDDHLIDEFQKLVGVYLPHIGADVDITKSALSKVFPNFASVHPKVRHTNYCHMNEATLQSLPEYRGWLDADFSALLFLSGLTSYEGRKMQGCTHCWLSPAAIYMKERLTEKGRPVAFFSCQSELESSQESLKTVLAAVVVQVMQWQPQLLRHRLNHYKRILQGESPRSEEWKTTGHSWDSQHTSSSGAATAFEIRPGMFPPTPPIPPAETSSVLSFHLVKLLAALLMDIKDLDGGCTDVYIIIDRLDCCDTNISQVMNELTRMLRTLDNPAIRVKLAVIAALTEKGSWTIDYLSNEERRCVFACCNWNQMPLTSTQRSEKSQPLIWETTPVG